MIFRPHLNIGRTRFIQPEFPIQDSILDGSFLVLGQFSRPNVQVIQTHQRRQVEIGGILSVVDEIQSSLKRCWIDALGAGFQLDDVGPYTTAVVACGLGHHPVEIQLTPLSECRCDGVLVERFIISRWTLGLRIAFAQWRHARFDRSQTVENDGSNDQQDDDDDTTAISLQDAHSWISSIRSPCNFLRLFTCIKHDQFTGSMDSFFPDMAER